MKREEFSGEKSGRNKIPPLLMVTIRKSYCGFGAPTGQTPAQEPQSMQVAASMTILPSPSEIALTGHCGSQAPQLIHSSLITYAIIKNSSFTKCVISLYDIYRGNSTVNLIHELPLFLPGYGLLPGWLLPGTWRLHLLKDIQFPDFHIWKCPWCGRGERPALSGFSMYR